jgi:hypothetical protein
MWTKREIQLQHLMQLYKITTAKLEEIRAQVHDLQRQSDENRTAGLDTLIDSIAEHILPTIRKAALSDAVATSKNVEDNVPAALEEVVNNLTQCLLPFAVGMSTAIREKRTDLERKGILPRPPLDKARRTNPINKDSYINSLRHL